MPFKSKAQQRYLYWAQPEGVNLKEWAKKTDFSKLPERAKRKKKDMNKKGSLSEMAIMYKQAGIPTQGDITQLSMTELANLAKEHSLLNDSSSLTDINNLHNGFNLVHNKGFNRGYYSALDTFLKHKDDPWMHKHFKSTHKILSKHPFIKDWESGGE